MPTPFVYEPHTAYAHTGRYNLGSLHATLRILSGAQVIDPPNYQIVVARANVEIADYRNAGGAIMLDPELSTFYGWRDISPDAPDPRLDDEFVIPGPDVDAGTWKITGVSRLRWGPDWALACVKVPS